MADAIDMNIIEYRELDTVPAEQFIPILNNQKTRNHLMEHPQFDARSIQDWIEAKCNVNAISGCKVRAILHQGKLVGWCGIQQEASEYEIAIVMDQSSWGLGIRVFKDVMGWAKELGHQEVAIHFLHTRREYRFLKKIARRVYQRELLGNLFTTYVLAVS